jgi:putative protease
MTETGIGKVTHYFGHLGVAAIELRGPLSVGDLIHIKGRTTDLMMKVDSLQVNHVDVHAAQAGISIGARVPEHVREHDVVFKLAA